MKLNPLEISKMLQTDRLIEIKDPGADVAWNAARTLRTLKDIRAPDPIICALTELG